MERKFAFLVLALLCIMPAFAQNAYVDENVKMARHPRILLQRGEEKALLKQIKKDTIWMDVHQRLLKQADEILDKPTNERIKIGRRLLSVSRDNLRRIFLLSYAYRTTGQKKYFTRAEAEMLKAASFEDWNPSHFLDVAEMTMAVSIGYDWLYDHLSPASRATLEHAIIEKGIKPSYGPGMSWIKGVNNWNQVCHGGMTYGSLAIWEKDPKLAAGTINRAIEHIRIPMAHYAPDGAYPEGVGYWSYGTSFNLMFLSAVEKCFGTDYGLSRLPGFLNTGNFILHMTTPALNNFAFSDNGTKAGFLPEMFWFYDKTKDPSILYSQSILYKAGRDRALRGRLAPATVIWGASAPLASAVEPSTLNYKADGDNPVCAMRSSWTGPKAAYLGFKAGSPSRPHAHMDAGSFIYEYDGVLWAMDMGTEEYNSLETKGVDLWNGKQDSQRWDVYRYRNTSHNTLTFNLQRQEVKGVVEIARFTESPDKVTAVADLTPVYESQVRSARRAVSLVDRKDAVIEDRVTCGRNFTMMTWTLVTPATPKVVSDTVVELEKDGKKVYIQVDSPTPLRWKIEPAESRFTFNNPNPGVSILCFDTDLKVGETQTFTVYITPDEARTVGYKSELE